MATGQLAVQNNTVPRRFSAAYEFFELKQMHRSVI